MPDRNWIIKREREELGQSIKKMVDSTSTESLGYRFQRIKTSLEILERDGRFSKEGIQSLCLLVTLIHQLVNYKHEPKNKKYW